MARPCRLPGPSPTGSCRPRSSGHPIRTCGGARPTTRSTRTSSDIVPLMFNGVGGSTILYAGDWPRMTPSDFRVRTLDGVADDWPLTYEELEPYYDRIAARGRRLRARRRPRLPGGSRSAAAAAPARRRAHRRRRGPTTGSAGTGGRRRTRSCSAPYRGRHPCAQWGSCSRAARRARRHRPTSRTGRRRSSAEPRVSPARA